MDAWLQELMKQGVLGLVLAGLAVAVWKLANRAMDDVAKPLVERTQKFMDACERNQENHTQAVDKISDTLRVMETRQTEHINICKGTGHA